ncbi:phosphopantothenate--cysteine ligase [Pectinophora gossypiella]|uniref:phosphopantothenate--cysteine ligase n=1 Tax=Pectinophora gossypiella TaxID=13191 RepID=UPI00214E0B9C|nr:phosphopantothenate--cysteine ligase [Pectinophora gossypiella]XP_049870563.1 phosphopantothenate--cysteine ligase [Pectinophora gossypiella]XP_049870564.1 phosphopantothenate--cysteine ligase [Pectinophora gossypiella]
MASSSWEEFFAVHLPPTDFEDNRSLLKEFCERHDQYGNKIVLITSGGTTVPLEHNTVRFVDNFSAGTRGSASAEHFLEQGYAVIFMHRQKSLEPFTRHFSGQKLLDMLDIQERGPNTSITVKPDSVDVLAPILLRYKAAHAAGAILHVSFTTVSEYFWLLRAACECLANLGPRAVLYLAAAVSDFYIPKDRVPTHKMQSESGAPVIQLHLVPKMLAPLCSLWVPEAYVVSFKLETDENLLIPKARAALDKYKHKMVVANMLQTRHHRVILVTPEVTQEILLTREEVHAGVDIESAIVCEIVTLHALHMSLSGSALPPAPPARPR